MNNKIVVGVGILIAVLVLFPMAAKYAGGSGGESGGTDGGAVPEAATQVAQAAATALTQGDMAAVAAKFDATMKAALPPDKLQASWGPVTGQFGAFKSLGTPKASKAHGQNVIVIPCTMERGSVNLQVAVNDAGEISGLYVKP